MAASFVGAFSDGSDVKPGGGVNTAAPGAEGGAGVAAPGAGVGAPGAGVGAPGAGVGASMILTPRERSFCCAEAGDNALAASKPATTAWTSSNDFVGRSMG